MPHNANDKYAQSQEWMQRDLEQVTRKNDRLQDENASLDAAHRRSIEYINRLEKENDKYAQSQGDLQSDLEQVTCNNDLLHAT